MLENNIEYNKLKEKENDNKELVEWVSNLNKKINSVGIPILIVSILTTLISYGIFSMSLLPVSILIGPVLSLVMTGFIATCACAGILLYSNGLLLVNKKGLDIYGKKIKEKISKIISRTQIKIPKISNPETKNKITVNSLKNSNNSKASSNNMDSSMIAKNRIIVPSSTNANSSKESSNDMNGSMIAKKKIRIR